MNNRPLGCKLCETPFELNETWGTLCAAHSKAYSCLVDRMWDEMNQTKHFTKAARTMEASNRLLRATYD